MVTVLVAGPNLVFSASLRPLLYQATRCCSSEAGAIGARPGAPFFWVLATLTEFGRGQIYLFTCFIKRSRFFSCLGVNLLRLPLNGFSPVFSAKRTGVPLSLNLLRNRLIR